MRAHNLRPSSKSWLAVAAAVIAVGTTAACVTLPPKSSEGNATIAPPNNRVTPVARYGQLAVRGAALVGANGAPAALRGQGFGWDNWWPQYYNADVVHWLRDDWCVDVVRPAMGIEPDGAYLSNPTASKQRMTAVVDAAIAAGVYVIIDWHAHHLHQAEAVAFFSEMAERYGKHPNVLYEIYNEPEKDQTWPQVKDYATAVIAAIRRHDPDNIVIVGSPEWDQRIDLVAAEPLLGQTNVVYSVHFYAGTHRAWLRERVQAAIAAGIPVFVSESSGAEASGQGKSDYPEWKAWVDFMDKNHVSWLNYSVSDKPGETISVLEPGARGSGGWGDAELTESGEHVRKLLRSYCQ
jgi:endoglucanase